MKTEAVRNPFNGERVGSVSLATESQLADAVAAADKAFAETRRQSARDRSAVLKRAVAGLRDHAGELTELLIAEAGKPRKYAEIEVSRAQETFSFAANEALRSHSETIAMSASAPGRGHMGWAERFPIGVILGITPFNFPLNLVAHKVAPCLATGNTMIVKPALKAPLSALRLGEILREAGMPRDQVIVLPFDHDSMPRLLEDERIKMISFTGSAEVGWKLKAQSGRRRVALELGGNAAAIIHHDADWREAVPSLASGAFGYAGQSCISVQRIFVQRKIYAEFRDAFVAHTKNAVRTGDPRDPEVTVGPMIDAKARERLLGWVEEALARGAKALTGEATQRGPCVEPIVLEDVPHDARISCEEAFGPVVLLEPYESFDDALRMTNDSRYGLQAGVFTRDLELAYRAFETLEMGGVMINQVPTFRVENMPYGGVKDSGFGREGIRYAMEEMTELRLCVVKRGGQPRS